MRLRLRTLLLFLTPALWPALSPAASIEARRADGSAQVLTAPAQRQGPDPLGERIERQYRSSYYYALAQLALQRELLADAELALQRAQETDPQSPLLARERGEVLEALGREAQAALQLEQALKHAPEDLALRQRLGRVYIQLQKPELAQALFLGPEGVEPSDPEHLRFLIGMDLGRDDLASAERRLRALLKRGGNADDQELLAALLQKGSRPQEAVEVYRQLLAASPERSTAWARLAASLDAQGDTGAALQALEQGWKAVPDSGLLADQVGRLNYRLGRYEASEAAFGSLLKADAKDSDSLLYRGLSRLKLKRYADAEADFQALGKLKDDSPSQAYGLALALTLQRKYGEAEAALKKVLDLNAQAEPAWVQLAFLYERQGQMAKAEAALKKGLKALPASEELSLLLAAAHQAQGEKEEALQVLRDAVRRGGGDALRFQLAVQLDKSGDFAKAEEVLQALIKDQPKHAQALNYLGYSWAERGEKLPEAEALIRRALDVDPDNHYYLDSLGWALHRQARHAEAEKALARAAELAKDPADPEEAVVLEHLAAAREALGRHAEAAEALARAKALREAAAKAKPENEELP